MGQNYHGQLAPADSGRADTVKFSTIIFIVLGLITPLWLITLPLFWYLAYKSYKGIGRF